MLTSPDGEIRYLAETKPFNEFGDKLKQRMSRMNTKLKKTKKMVEEELFNLSER